MANVIQVRLCTHVGVMLFIPLCTITGLLPLGVAVLATILDTVVTEDGTAVSEDVTVVTEDFTVVVAMLNDEISPKTHK